jgi:hypothetical protein
MKFQVQENTLAGGYNLTHELRALSGEKLAADFEHPDSAAQSLDEPKCMVAIRDVQSDYEAILYA